MFTRSYSTVACQLSFSASFFVLVKNLSMYSLLVARYSRIVAIRTISNCTYQPNWNPVRVYSDRSKTDIQN